VPVKKEILFKRIDFINEDIRFWHNLTIALLSGLGGIAYMYAQGKLRLNWLSAGFILLGILSLVAIAFIIRYNHKKREKLLKEIERLKER
jgi:hypothetical protein